MPQAEHELSVLKESPVISETVKIFLVNLIYWLIESIANIDVGQEAQENIKALDEQLKTSSVVLYGYHSSLFDSIVLPIILSKQLNNVNTMIAPVAITHSQGIKKVFLDVITYLTNTQFPPIIRKKDEPHYEHKMKRKLLKQLIEITRQNLSEPGNIYGVAPMGTRGKVLKADEVQPGFISVAQKFEVPLMPIALTQNKSGLLQFKAGEIISPPDSSTSLDESVNMYMNSLAQLLSVELRGDYK
jgi:1-acyl-sn-glycerol-3-phosphate acyltransferase